MSWDQRRDERLKDDHISSSSYRERDRERDRNRDRERDRVRERDRDRDRERDRDRVSKRDRNENKKYKSRDKYDDENYRCDYRSSSRDDKRKERRRKSRSRSFDRRRNRSRRRSRSRSNERHRRSSSSYSSKVAGKGKYIELEAPPPPIISDIQTGNDKKIYEFFKCEKEESPKQSDNENVDTHANKNELDDLHSINLPSSDEIKIKDEPELSYHQFDDTVDEAEREKVQKEIQEKLRQHLAAEGKIYPPPRPQASHPIFANDGSFLNMFKSLQSQQQQLMASSAVKPVQPVVPSVDYQQPIEPQQSIVLPVFGRRRGGKILKTGMVEKPKMTQEQDGDGKDAWSIYMQEVKKYKNTACDINEKSRPLLK